MQPPPAAAPHTAAATLRDDEATARMLLAQQVSMHGSNVPWSASGALLLGLLFVGLQWPTMAHGPLLAWAAALVGVLAARAALPVWRRRRQTADQQPPDRRWLQLFRANFLAHGLVWATASFLPTQTQDPMQLALLVMMLAGICASNFILNAFDLTAALLFGVPTMGALALRLLTGDHGVPGVMGVAVLAALGFFALTGRRAYRMVQENATLRLAEQRQNHLLRVLIENTGEGFWFIDNQARTVDANPAMCHMLGQPREALLGRSIFDFVDADNRAIFARELARRAAGSTAGYEIALRRADGSLVDCYNQATPIVDADGHRLGSVGLWTDISERKRAERQLQDTSEALRQKSQALEYTLGSISQGIVSFDSGGRLLAHNQRLRELLDLPADLFGPGTTRQSLRDFQARRADVDQSADLLDGQGNPLQRPADLDNLPDLYLRRVRTGQLVEVRTRHLADGGLVRTFADVTAYVDALRALAAREREQRELLDAFPGYIVVTDQAHRYLYANQRFADLIGRPQASIIGQHGFDVLGPARFQEVIATVDQVRPGAPQTRESDYPATPWRPRITLQATHAMGQDGATGERRMYAFAIDISASKAAEAAALAARDEAERANRAKSQFLSSMSHELRTPLNAILGFGHLLASDTVHPLSAAQGAQMDKILQGARHLLQLINEVLDLAVVETGSLPIQLQPVPLAPALADALALLQPLAHDRGIQLPTAAAGLDGAAGASAAVQADPVRLKQVLLNLLGNAIKYNRPHGTVTVRCEGLAQNGAAAGSAGWRITVQDTGPGLDAAQQAQLFGAFERLGAETTQVEGTGLGLALSRGLARAMGGDIGVHSQPGVGSSFWLRLLPAAAALPALPTPVEPVAPPASASSRTGSTSVVLYVEDNPVNVMLMEAMFERLPGLQLRVANTPQQGLQMATDDPPQLLLLDIQLPGMDGFELLALLRADPRTRGVPAVAISADAMPDSIARGLAAGFADYLTKPVDMDQVAAAVHAALGAG